MQRVLASLAGKTHLLLPYYIIVDSFKANNSNKEPILNICSEFYVLSQSFLSRYVTFGELAHLQSLALYFSRFIVGLW